MLRSAANTATHLERLRLALSVGGPCLSMAKMALQVGGNGFGATIETTPIEEAQAAWKRGGYAR